MQYSDSVVLSHPEPSVHSVPLKDLSTMLPIRSEVRAFANVAETLMSPARATLNADEIDMVRLYLKALDAMVETDTSGSVET